MVSFQPVDSATVITTDNNAYVGVVLKGEMVRTGTCGGQDCNTSEIDKCKY